VKLKSAGEWYCNLRAWLVSRLGWEQC